MRPCAIPSCRLLSWWVPVQMLCLRRALLQGVELGGLLGGDQPELDQVERADEAVADAEAAGAGDRRRAAAPPSGARSAAGPPPSRWGSPPARPRRPRRRRPARRRRPPRRRPGRRPPSPPRPRCRGRSGRRPCCPARWPRPWSGCSGAATSISPSASLCTARASMTRTVSLSRSRSSSAMISPWNSGCWKPSTISCTGPMATVPPLVCPLMVRSACRRRDRLELALRDGAWSGSVGAILKRGIAIRHHPERAIHGAA